LNDIDAEEYAKGTSSNQESIIMKNLFEDRIGA